MIHPQSVAMWRFFVAAPLTAKFGSSGAAAVRFFGEDAEHQWRRPAPDARLTHALFGPK